MDLGTGCRPSAEVIFIFLLTIENVQGYCVHSKSKFKTFRLARVDSTSPFSSRRCTLQVLGSTGKRVLFDTRGGVGGDTT